MSSKFNIELAQGTVTVEGDEEFIKSVYQALQDTLLSGDVPEEAPEKAVEQAVVEATVEAPAKAEEPEPEPVEAEAEAEATPEIEPEAPAGLDENVTPINVAEVAGEIEEIAETPIEDEDDGAASLESIKPKYEPIPAVLDPDRAEREKAEAEADEKAPVVEEARFEPAPANRGSVLEQIKESLDDDEDSGSQTSILQRIRDSLSEDSGDDEGEETPRAADAG